MGEVDKVRELVNHCVFEHVPQPRHEFRLSLSGARAIIETTRMAFILSRK